jgi:catechol 2,3-dioxygenase-like lactoylglutathione lyase family enzyme
MGFVATAQPEKALAFYRDVLGLRLVEDTPFAIVFDAHGITLRVQKAEKVVVPPYTTLGWQVADLDGVMTALEEKGVTFQQFGMPGQDARGVWTAPGGARIAWFKDPDGHTLSLTAI